MPFIVLGGHMKKFIVGVFVIIAKIINELIQIHSIYHSLSMSERLEFWKIIAFGILINGIYGFFHGEFWDLLVIIIMIYAIMKNIKKERSANA